MKKKLLCIFLTISFVMMSAYAVQNVSLAWDKSCSPNIVGYNIYFGADGHTPGTNVVYIPDCNGTNGYFVTNFWSGNYSNKISVGNVTNTTISGLLEGVTYYFAATASDTLGLESDLSNETSYTVPNIRPAPVKNLRAE